MLIFILVDIQYLQNAAFCFEKGSNGQNHSPSDSYPPNKHFSHSKISHFSRCGVGFLPPP